MKDESGVLSPGLTRSLLFSDGKDSLCITGLTAVSLLP